MDPSGAGPRRGFRAPRAGEPTPGSRPDPVPAGETPVGTGPVDTLTSGPPRRVRRLDRRWPAAATLVVALVLVAGAAFLLGSRLSPVADRESGADLPAPSPKPSATPLAVPEVFQRVAPSVVLITTSKGSLGSGTIVTDTGTVLTAQHVVAGGGTVSITFADGTRSPATVASANAKTDTATLTPQKLPEVVVPATLGGGVTVGSDVVAIGNPLGLRASTSTGVVSGLNRTSRSRAGSLSGLIQFDAAVNPGSSGGPLLNDQGSVVGVVVSIADPGGDDAFAGIGFAVPLGAALGGTGDGSGPGGPRL